MDPIQVKIAKVGSTIVTVCVEKGSTVGQALEIAGISVQSADSMKVAGAGVDVSTVLTADTLITILPKIKGGAF